MKTQPTLKDIIGIAFICGSIAWMVSNGYAPSPEAVLIIGILILKK